jgi:hypothetical protein
MRKGVLIEGDEAPQAAAELGDSLPNLTVSGYDIRALLALCLAASLLSVYMFASATGSVSL